MSHWDSEAATIVRHPMKEWPDYPGWWNIDCGCCNGLEWGGEYPQECRDCGGNGYLAWHEKSHVLAWYPGGPLRGKLLPDDAWRSR